jgi:uncharacterized protein with GYD domain
VSLIYRTDQGIKSFNETTARAADAAAGFEKAGRQAHRLLDERLAKTA